MNKKSQDFSIDEAIALANSPQGQQLLQALQHTDSQKLALAQQQAASGSYQQAGQTLQSMLSSPEIRELIKKLGG